MHRIRWVVPFLIVAGCSRGPDGSRAREVATVADHGSTDGAADAAQAERAAARYLFVWAGDADRRESDFLAVLDVAPAGPRYGRLVTTLPVGERGTMPHHVEHELSAGGMLFANGFMTGRTYRFDVRDPLAPRLTGAFTERAGFSYPHSYTRLPDGHVLAAFQGRGLRNVDPGGLVELDAAGAVVRSASAADPRRPDALLRPYSLAVVPALDRVVTTSYDMGEDMGLRGGRRGRTRVVQVWRLSDLGLLRTIDLPPGPRGGEGEQPGEPRVLADGRTVLVATFACGLYRLTDLASDRPGAAFVHSFAGGGCAVPVVVGPFWIQSVPSAHALVALDVTDPTQPREVARLVLGPRHNPHWLALDRAGNRLVVADRGDGERRLLMVRVDPATGALTPDDAFREAGAERPGFSFDRAEWPHGTTGSAVPHGTVFGF